MVDDPRIRAGIFAGESGGDYDALYGYSNRPGGAWEDVRPTRMTVGEVLALQEDRGPESYGRWVAGRNDGVLSTPVGAYQVVGRTLRSAVDALGLDPDTPFDRETQDRIGEWVLQTQGTGAWRGYKRGAAMPDEWSEETVQAAIDRPQGQPAAGSGPAGGGMSMSVIERMAKAAAARMSDETGAAPKDAFLAALMALGHNLSRMSQGETVDVGYGVNMLAKTTAARKGEAGRNRTADWLEAQGMPQLADAVRSGQMTAKEAYDLAQKGAAGGLDMKDKLAVANTLRDDLRVELSDFNDVKNGWSNIKELATDINTSGFNDTALIVAFTKILDPGSVAREGEVAAVQSNMGSLVERFGERFRNAFQSTGVLPPDIRQQVVNAAHTLYTQRQKSAEATYRGYMEQAQKLGIDPGLIFMGRFAGPESEVPRVPNASGSSQPGGAGAAPGGAGGGAATPQPGATVDP